MVVNYCGRSMTEPNDKLPALSGMAQRYASLMGWPHGDYLAGLWRSTLVSDLLWIRDEGYSSEASVPDPSKTGRRYGWAPSWSWTSMDGGIRYYSLPDGHVPDTVHVLSCATTKPGEERDPFGQVLSGKLDVACSYMTLWARPHVQEEGELYYQVFDADNKYVTLLTVDHPPEMGASNMTVSKGPQFQPISPSDLTKGIMVYCLGLIVEHSPRTTHGKIGWAGVVVRRLIHNNYARVGNCVSTRFKAEGESRFVIV